MKIRPVGAELLHAGRQAAMAKLRVPYREFRAKRLTMCVSTGL